MSFMSGQKIIISALAVAAAAFLFVAAPRAQEQQPPPAPPSQRPTSEPVELGEDDVLKIDTDLVLVDVSVTDAEGRAVKGLRPEDFKLYEDGDERPVAFLNVERRAGA